MAIISPTQHSTTVKTLGQSEHLISILHPALTGSLHFAVLFQRLLSTTTFFLCVRLSIFILYTSNLLWLNSYYASKVLLLNAFYASKLLGLNLLCTSKLIALRLASTIWKCTEKARKKLFFEFMIWILNPNALALLIFWPGWIVVALVYFACSYL